MRINRVDLLTKLETLSPGLSPQEVVEQSSCIVFRDGYAYTFNDEISVRARTPLKIDGAVAAAPLLNLLRKMPEDEVEIVAADGQLKVAGKRRRAGVRMEAEITLPIGNVETPTTWKPLHPEFGEAISTVEGCAGRDESKFYLTCVHLTPKWVEACDNLQATRYRLQTGFAAPALVRRDSIRHIAALGATEFCETETWLHFRGPQKTILSMRRFVEDYPSLKDILTVEGETTQLPRGLAEAAERADVFAAENSDADSVMISLSPEKLTLRAESALGWYSETKKVKYAGQPLAFLIVPKILGAIVKKHSACVVTRDRLKVDGGKFIYVTVLGVPPEIAKDNGDAESED
jgi:hypothetical protein